MKSLLGRPLPAQVLALTVTLRPEGTRLAGCLLTRKADTIVVDHQWPELPALEHLRTSLPETDVPVVLTLEGRGILHKENAAPLPALDAEVIALLLPGAPAAEFYVQRNTGAYGYYATFVRRAIVESILADVRAQGRHVVAVEAGPFSLPELVVFLEPEWLNTTVRCGQYTVSLQEGKIAQLSVAPEEPVTDRYLLGGQELTSQLLSAYAAGVRVLLGQEIIGLAPDISKSEQREWEQRILFRRRSIIILIAFLLALLANFLVFTQLSGVNQRLTAQMAFSQQELQTLDTLRQTVQRQKQFLQSAGWLTTSHQSVYTDQLAASIPAGLQLIQLDINPVDELATRQRSEVVFRQNTILVKGKCREAQVLNDWLQRLSRLPWARQIQQPNFTYDYGAGTGTFSFTIQLPPAQ